MIRSQFEQMNAREQILVLVTAILLLVYLAYLFIYEPIQQSQQDAIKQLDEKKQTLLWMNQVKHLADHATKKNINSTSQLLSILTDQLALPNLKPFPYQLQQRSGGNVQLSFDKVPFNPFIEWLFTFQSNYSISIDRLTATKLDKEGMVKLVIIFN